MDSKKVIEKLVRIAESQQKIINKLAQTLPTGGDSGGEHSSPDSATPPQHLDPNKTQKKPGDALMAALPRGIVQSISESGSDLLVTFVAGKRTQQNYDTVKATAQKLTDQGVLQHAYNIKAV